VSSCCCWERREGGGGESGEQEEGREYTLDIACFGYHSNDLTCVEVWRFNYGGNVQGGTPFVCNCVREKQTLDTREDCPGTLGKGV